ncbi:hypothetical protein QQZ08_010952 [Neonectria magnoliae]|uniref:Uncharacterized protein n=1 Tax=Neonectria magnoliae TaxID=2732573 RepID=A0ABR1HDF2_9HYPO
MRFTTAAVVLLANGITAMPWSLGASKQSSELSNTGDIILHVKVSQAPAHKDNSAAEFDICLRVCWPRTPECPTGWYSNNVGTKDQPCWTCCKAPEFESSL